ncbi:DegT/DnrJ/EryC1/StrS family aminotransferase [Litorilinea aerophila]|uniref:DegT/DnrJ/EryC1/StrS family aminotransferase n=1 Tax=Litorilinea aerophila TaxID=1204385 RepID=A0A540V8Z7_9CHLR|nr:DegT/DnrJ/EryC1/StrS family aminotransferase [Litorilinea aerophila]MCC9078824.1 DegT/DnrJ/EryC1/StrS family aminotransferase [Litorilinea aerophila]OUC05912.1 erythromycin biosynthesis sensory transduction protein eryC1 [Litorilinea aerophila]
MAIAEPIPLVDLRAQYLALKDEIDAAVARVLDSGWYILGQEVRAFEAEFAAFCQPPDGAAPGCVAVNSGTDALHLALRACGVQPGDQVITVSHTAVATAAAIQLAGATPVFVDVDPETCTLDPKALADAVGPQTRAIVPVHLYGHPADLAPILAIAREAGIPVIEDCAQAHGAQYRGRPVGTWGDLGCFSFYPTKNLGALGDGGAVIGRDPELVERVRLLREYGWTPSSRYVSQVPGLNSRLDEIQAAILRVKLRHLRAWNEKRRELAAHYRTHLPAWVHRPVERPDSTHVYHLYVVRVPQRDRVQQHLRAKGIGTGIHYPVPVHQQPAYQAGAQVAHPLVHTERLAGEILSLPMHPMMTPTQVEQVATALADALPTIQS